MKVDIAKRGEGQRGNGNNYESMWEMQTRKSGGSPTQIKQGYKSKIFLGDRSFIFFDF